MKGSRSLGLILLVLPLMFLTTCAISTNAHAQRLPEIPRHSTSSNDCGCPRGDDPIPVSSGMLAPFLPTIPNLEFGFLYSFGNSVRTGRFTADYVLPFRLNSSSVLFGEAHAEGWDFWKRPVVAVASAPGFTTIDSPSRNRVDLSFGGGYRTMLGTNTLLGLNGFYDASRLYKQWSSSGGLGLELAANAAGDDAIDLNINWYGNLFNRDVLVNAFRNRGNSFDVEAGYSHGVFDHALDLRLKLAGYQFDIGTAVRGWRGGADLTTRDGVFTVRYEYGHDPINGYYNTVGGFVNVGFRLENLLSGESPFTLPEPVFRSPRDLRRLLGLKVKRNWHQPEAVVMTRSSTVPPTPVPPTPVPPTPPACNLPGNYIIRVAIPVGVYQVVDNPPIPAVVTSKASICWCMSTTDQLITNMFIVDSGGVVWAVASPLAIQPGNACTLTTLIQVGMIGPSNSLQFSTSLGPLTFGPGGGISVQVNQ